MSATVLRYEPRPDRNIELRTSIVELAQRHRRYGVGMIYLKLRQRGQCVNYKRVERLYRLEKLQVRRRRCNDPLISCSGVMFPTETAHEYRDG